MRFRLQREGAALRIEFDDGGMNLLSMGRGWSERHAALRRHNAE